MWINELELELNNLAKCCICSLLGFTWILSPENCTTCHYNLTILYGLCLKNFYTNPGKILNNEIILTRICVNKQTTLSWLHYKKSWFTRELSFQKQLEIYLWAKIQENSLTDQLVTKGWKQVRCNNKKTILEKPVFPIRFFQKVLETSVQWNLDLTKGQATGKMCLPYQQGFVTWRFFFISYHDWGKENHLLYRGLCCTEVHYIEVPL